MSYCYHQIPSSLEDFFVTKAAVHPASAAPVEDGLYVRKYGNGPAILLALHGFGRHGGRMERLAYRLGDTFTTLAPDLPYHGNSYWTADQYAPANFSSLLNTLLKAHEQQPVYLLGHSLGGRLLSTCLPDLRHPDLRDLALVAPDGAGGRYTNWVDTLPKHLVRPLASLTKRPRGVLKLSGWLRRRGIINRYSAEYLHHNLRDHSFRRRLAGTLRSVLNFPPQPAALESALRERGMSATVFAGDRDPLLHHKRLAEIYGPLPSVRVLPYRGSHWLPEHLLLDYYLHREIHQ